MVSNNLSRNFQNRQLISQNKNGIGLIEILGESLLNSSSDLTNIIEHVYYWLKGIRNIEKAVFYEHNDMVDTANKGKIKYIHRAKYEDYYIEKKSLEDEISISLDNVDSLFSSPYEYNKKKLKKVLGKNFTNNLLNRDDDIVFLHAPRFPENESCYKYIAILTFNSSSKTTIGEVKKYFTIVNNIYDKYYDNNKLKRSNLINETITEIFEISSKEVNIRTSLNEIATQIAEKTESQFCFIYMTAEEYHHHSQHDFYLGGAGKGEVDFADRRFEPTAGIIGNVLENKRPLYSIDFFNDTVSHGLLNKSLLDHGLEQPELYAYPLIQKNKNAIEVNPNGVVLLLRENKNGKYSNIRPNKKTVEGMLLKYSEYLSQITATKANEQINKILVTSVQELIKISNELYLKKDNKEYQLLNFISSIQKNILPKWEKIINPLYLAIYKRNDNKFIMQRNINSVLEKKINTETPTFDIGRGLTGSVINQKESELYEPFIEDYEKHNKEIIDSRLKPDNQCKLFWNKIVGDYHRMFYGKHLGIGFDNYVILFIGRRREEFMPSIGYKLAKEFIKAIEPTLINIIKTNKENEPIDKSCLEAINDYEKNILEFEKELSSEDKVELKGLIKKFLKDKSNDNIKTHKNFYEFISKGLTNIMQEAKSIAIKTIVEKLSGVFM